MKKLRLILTFLALLFLTAPVLTASSAQVPVPGMITMVDLGAHTCIPCKMMAPILEKLTVEYEGRAAIVFIDVWQDAAQAKRFKVSVIPTQVFFAEDGNEVFRHVGFMNEEAIIDQLTKMGVESPQDN
ncbi:MAG: thioredoxin domain-containing protein [Desulfobulbaceae bacterium]|jgi:thioredoxin 1|nr:thioredoxin domain-containing protein [Desulfobulbaceae bacterium]